MSAVHRVREWNPSEQSVGVALVVVGVHACVCVGGWV